MIGFESDEAVLQKLRERLRNITDNELIQFGKSVAKLSAGPAGTSNPFQRQLEEAIAEWKRRKKLQDSKPNQQQMASLFRRSSMGNQRRTERQ